MKEINVSNGSELTDEQLRDALSILAKFCIHNSSSEDGCKFCRLSETCRTRLNRKGFFSLAYMATEELYGEDEL